MKEGKSRRQPPDLSERGNVIPQQDLREKGRKTVSLPARIGTVAELDALIRTLSDLRRELSHY